MMIAFVHIDDIHQCGCFLLRFGRTFISSAKTIASNIGTATIWEHPVVTRPLDGYVLRQNGKLSNTGEASEARNVRNCHGVGAIWAMINHGAWSPWSGDSHQQVHSLGFMSTLNDDHLVVVDHHHTQYDAFWTMAHIK